MRCNITNRADGVRSFQAGGRFLTLAGGETERNVELSKEEADALNATAEFHVREIEPPAKPKAEKPVEAAPKNPIT